MSNFYEIDFHEVGDKGSGDAISLRYRLLEGEDEVVHVVDGGYSEDGQKVLDHIAEHYSSDRIDHVVLTHPDGDHAGGLKTIVQEANVGILWMNRPWLYVDELIPLFDYEYTRDGLIQRLKKNFPHTAELEKIAEERNITIKEAFQGSRIGAFTVLSPTREGYVDLIVNSEKTPEPEREAGYLGKVYEKVVTVVRHVKSFWGEESLKGGVGITSRENEMSIVQYAELNENKILLTGDVGVEGLEESYNFLTNHLGVALPGITRFQLPHHGSRRNLSSDILDKFLGSRLARMPSEHELSFSAIASANKEDPHHPKNAVKRAIWHRGGQMHTTEEAGWHCWFSGCSPREGCGSAILHPYPEDDEE